MTLCGFFLSSSVCGGQLHCKRPHSEVELGEWLARWKHRDQCRKEGSLRPIRASPQGDRGDAIPISASKVSAWQR